MLLDGFFFSLFRLKHCLLVWVAPAGRKPSSYRTTTQFHISSDFEDMITLHNESLSCQVHKVYFDRTIAHVSQYHHPVLKHRGVKQAVRGLNYLTQRLWTARADETNANSPFRIILNGIQNLASIYPQKSPIE